MFEGLSSRLQQMTAKLRGKSRVTDQDIKEMMKEIRLALLEADVNFKVVKQLTQDLAEKCQGVDIMKSLTPGQQIVKVVHEALTELLGSESADIVVNPGGFTTIMLYGLQGAGKTTAAAKLALMLRKKGKKVMLTSVDVHRPAAAQQLAILAKQIDVPCYIQPEESQAERIAQAALERAKYMLCDTLIVDTAGRMTVDDEMMAELKAIATIVKPDEKLLIVDAMIGQEAVNVALAFEAAIGLDGYILTKLDGDARGGAALSIKHMTGKPIKLIGLGEKINPLEVFYPDRMANRILGMGDVLSFIDKVSAEIDQELAAKTAERLLNNTFTMDDMLDQLQQLRKMGSIKDLLIMIPGVNPAQFDAVNMDDAQFTRMVAIIQAMTLKERRHPQLLNASRRKRIARGSGTQVADVNRLVRQYEEMSKMMKQFGGLGKKGKFGLGKSLAGLKQLKQLKDFKF